MNVHIPRPAGVPCTPAATLVALSPCRRPSLGLTKPAVVALIWRLQGAAALTQLVEYRPSKPAVTSSNLVRRFSKACSPWRLDPHRRRTNSTAAQRGNPAAGGAGPPQADPCRTRSGLRPRRPCWEGRVASRNTRRKRRPLLLVPPTLSEGTLNTHRPGSSDTMLGGMLCTYRPGGAV